MTQALTRFWFPLRPGLGIGVTAVSAAEASELAQATRAKLFPQAVMGDPVADVDLQTLDARHVLPNVGLVAVRGVWFPPLNQR